MRGLKARRFSSAKRFGHAHEEPEGNACRDEKPMKMKIICQSATSRSTCPAPRRDDRHDHEHHHDERHHLRHLASAKPVAHHGDGDDPRRRRPHALQGAHEEQHPEAWREGRENRGGDINAEADQQRPAPAETVRYRSEDQLSGTETDHIGRDDELALVFVLDAERGTDHAAWPAA